MQVVGYDTGVGGDEGSRPAGLLVARHDGTGEDADARAPVERIDLAPGTDLDYSLGERRCAGTIHDGRHIACSADRAPRCPSHEDVWVCARCTGTCLKAEMDCHEEHAVYLAAFAPDRFKVGVTRSWRLATRLEEQGADRGVRIRTVENGRIAREIEAELAGEIDGLVDRVRVADKRAGIAASIDEAAWNDLLERFDPERRFAFDYGLDLAERPMSETMASGRVLGTKGRLLVVERDGSTYAIDLRDLVGHELVAGRSTRDIQSSLGAFDT